MKKKSCFSTAFHLQRDSVPGAEPENAKVRLSVEPFETARRSSGEGKQKQELLALLEGFRARIG